MLDFRLSSQPKSESEILRDPNKWDSFSWIMSPPLYCTDGKQGTVHEDVQVKISVTSHHPLQFQRKRKRRVIDTDPNKWDSFSWIMSPPLYCTDGKQGTVHEDVQEEKPPNQLNDGSTNRPTDPPTYRPTKRTTDKRIDQHHDALTERQTRPPTDQPTHRLTEHLNYNEQKCELIVLREAPPPPPPPRQDHVVHLLITHMFVHGVVRLLTTVSSKSLFDPTTSSQSYSTCGRGESDVRWNLFSTRLDSTRLSSCLGPRSRRVDHVSL
ncbi:hypothetical protein F2P81_018137 [Scophthalmus maximus]|uniref:Uncharacterized protein n=1 Tax=Scophthalmus maximus TaxID=52904 RepID=A0A6A4SEU9_SCOMX|nr:hypothetical protein F2P81_018137 [Scophthalmus maximus]